MVTVVYFGTKFEYVSRKNIGVTECVKLSWYSLFFFHTDYIVEYLIRKENKSNYG